MELLEEARNFLFVLEFLFLSTFSLIMLICMELVLRNEMMGSIQGLFDKMTVVGTQNSK